MKLTLKNQQVIKTHYINQLARLKLNLKYWTNRHKLFLLGGRGSGVYNSRKEIKVAGFKFVVARALYQAAMIA